MKSRLFEASVLALAIVVAALVVHAGFGKMVDRDRVVSVRGFSVREVPADKVFWSLSYTVLGNDVSELYKDLESKDSVVIEFLVNHGILKEDITANAPWFENLDLNPYSENKSGFHYSGKSTLMIVTKNVSKVRPLQRDIMQLAKREIVFDGNSARYEFLGLNQIKPQMIEEATRNARAAAQKFANDSESQLGKIKSASQGLFSIDNRDENSPQIKVVRVVTTVNYSLED